MTDLFPFALPGEFNPFGPTPPKKTWGVNFGGGVNSSALLLTLRDRGLRPHWVVFADTGSERPETYENVVRVEAWSKKVGFPFDTTNWTRVKGERAGEFQPLHEACLATSYLPSKAYGKAGCTYKWKIQPMERWRKANGFTPTYIAIGYDAGEKQRLKNAKAALCGDYDLNADETPWYPLIGFDMNRKACEKRLAQEGWPVVKSACFMCPNMRPPEWEALKVEHPDLYAIAVKIQDTAKAAGNAETVNLFRAYDPNNATCVCTADGCLTKEDP